MLNRLRLSVASLLLVQWLAQSVALWHGVVHLPGSSHVAIASFEALGNAVEAGSPSRADGDARSRAIDFIVAVAGGHAGGEAACAALDHLSLGESAPVTPATPAGLATHAVPEGGWSRGHSAVPLQPYQARAPPTRA